MLCCIINMHIYFNTVETWLSIIHHQATAKKIKRLLKNREEVNPTHLLYPHTMHGILTEKNNVFQRSYVKIIAEF